MLAEAGKRWPAALGPRRRSPSQDGARTPFADGQFDIVTISAVLHHVPLAERQAVYRELGRVAEAGRADLCLRAQSAQSRWCATSSPARRSTRTPSCSTRSEVRHGLLDAARYDIAIELPDVHAAGDHFPARRSIALLAWLPLGAQYAVAARKAA